MSLLPDCVLVFLRREATTRGTKARIDSNPCWIEIGLVLIALLLAFLWPRLGSDWSGSSGVVADWRAGRDCQTCSRGLRARYTRSRASNVADSRPFRLWLIL